MVMVSASQSAEARQYEDEVDNPIRTAAREYLARGWQPVLIPRVNGQPAKGPRQSEWQHLRYTESDLHLFTAEDNLGLLLGEPSGGLTDVDLDCQEAVFLGQFFLTATDMRSGREKNPYSHDWYIVDTPSVRRTAFEYKLKNEDRGVMLVEFRATGCQTVVPPSFHPDGDQYVWHQFGEPAKVKATDLQRTVQKIAIGSLLARFWPPQGARHDAGLAVAGVFLSVGWEEDEAADLVFLAAQAAGHKDPHDRKAAVYSTYRNSANGRQTKGIPTLTRYMPEEIVDTLVRWCREISPNPDFWRQKKHERAYYERQEEHKEQAAQEETPRPLRRSLPDPEPFPLASLASLAAPTLVLVNTIQAPVALCAQSVLAAATLAVQPYRNVVIDGRTYPLSEYFITVGESGERKSAVDTEVLRPHRAHERALCEKYEADRLGYENDYAAYTKAKDEALRKAKTRAEKKQVLDDLGAPPCVPLLPMMLIHEPSYEGLIKLFLVGQPSIGLFAHEGGRMVGGYAMSEDHQLKTAAGLSEVWDGKSVSRVRGGDGAALLHGRRLSMHLMAQPAVAQRLLSNRLLIDQGLTARCLTVWSASTAGTRKYREVNLRTEKVMLDYEARILAILKTPLPLAEEKTNELDPRPLYLSKDAKTLWIKFHDKIEVQLADGAPLAPVRGFANKVPEHALRLAGVLTLYDNLNAAEISPEYVGLGIKLAQHYLSEALRLFHASMSDPDLELAEKLLAWAQQRGQEVALADIYQRGPNAIRDGATARKIAAILAAHGWFVPVPGGKEIDGQFRREVWEVKQ